MINDSPRKLASSSPRRLSIIRPVIVVGNFYHENILKRGIKLDQHHVKVRDIMSRSVIS